MDSDYAIHSKRFSPEVFRNDHPSNSKNGGVCLYYRTGLPIKRRFDLELLQEMIVSEIAISRKKIFFINLYRSPSQNSEQFEIFIGNLQRVLTNIRNERPSCIVFTGDFNCRSSQWWTEESSLDINCQHQIIFGNLNLSLPSPPPYNRTVWHYSRANAQSIINSINSVNWVSNLNPLGPSEVVDYFAMTLYKIMSLYIPNESIKINDKDPPWLTHELTTAIKRKHRVYKKFVRHGRNQEDWTFVRNLQLENTKKIIEAKNKYFFKLGKKLSDPHIGVKSYWSILNKLIDKKKFVNIPPILENGLFVTNLKAKASLFNNYFVGQCSVIETNSTLPAFRPRCSTSLQSVDIDREKVLNIICSLYPNKAHGCDDISVSMIKICDSAILEPLCLTFEKCLETGIYPTSWKRANVIPVHKKNCNRVRVTIAQFPFTNFLENI